MKQIDYDDLPSEIKEMFYKQKIDLLLNTIENAELLLEFEDFTNSEECLKINSIDDYFIEFAKKYPNKLHICPKEDQYDKIFIKEFHK